MPTASNINALSCFGGMVQDVAVVHMATVFQKGIIAATLLTHVVQQEVSSPIVHMIIDGKTIFNCCLVNIGDMLDNGTVMNGKMIESPKSFQVACIVMTQIIATVASNQYGGQSVDIKHLGKYLRKSYDKFKTEIAEKYKGKLPEDTIEDLVQDRLKAELKAGVQTDRKSVV